MVRGGGDASMAGGCGSAWTVGTRVVDLWMTRGSRGCWRRALTSRPYPPHAVPTPPTPGPMQVLSIETVRVSPGAYVSPSLSWVPAELVTMSAHSPCKPTSAEHGAGVSASGRLFRGGRGVMDGWLGSGACGAVKQEGTGGRFDLTDVGVALVGSVPAEAASAALEK